VDVAVSDLAGSVISWSIVVVGTIAVLGPFTFGVWWAVRKVRADFARIDVMDGWATSIGWSVWPPGPIAPITQELRGQPFRMRLRRMSVEMPTLVYGTHRGRPVTVFGIWHTSRGHSSYNRGQRISYRIAAVRLPAPRPWLEIHSRAPFHSPQQLATLPPPQRFAAACAVEAADPRFADQMLTPAVRARLANLIPATRSTIRVDTNYLVCIQTGDLDPTWTRSAVDELTGLLDAAPAAFTPTGVRVRRRFRRRPFQPNR
jgi:hypothetical protein